ncbi:MAG: class III poly(R)-hydroxyalkanoic acid synthase subunit PhaE [Nitrospirae bacterium]|nr:class III poly(R)-hydroxyalkanoic acid synthase subunit PhaE [Nitrospirota bacterium]
MSWSEQTETLMKALTEAQMQMWKSWCGLIQTAPTPPYPGFVDQWRALANQGLMGWTADSEQIVKDVAKRLLGAQDAMTRFLELSVNAWKTMAPMAESGVDWETTLKKYTGQLREQLLQSPEAIARTVQDTGELWRLYLEEWQKLTQPWAESLRRASWQVGRAATGDGSALIELTNLYWDAYERTFGRLLESPSLGHTRELNEELLKGFDAWLEFRRAGFEYQVKLAEAWAQGFEQFMQKLVSLAEAGEPVEGLRQLLSLWIDTVDEAFLAVFSSEEYARLQGHLVNTAMAYRIHERQIVEELLKISHVPSRSELDETHRRIYELRKELRELKKAVLEMRAGRSAHKDTEPESSGLPVKPEPSAGHKPTEEGG